MYRRIFTCVTSLVASPARLTSPDHVVLPHRCLSHANNASDSKCVKLAYQKYEDTKLQQRQGQREGGEEELQREGGGGRSPVLVMHGLLGCRSNWHSVCRELHRRTGRQVINIDARNHGDSDHADEMSYMSMAEDVLQLMQQLGLARASLVGHSMGGRVMMNIAVNYPERVDSLLVVDVSPHYHPASASSDVISIVTALASISLHQLPSNQLAARQLADRQLQQIIQSKTMRQFLLTNLVEVDGEVRWRFNLPAIHTCLQLFRESVHVKEGATYDGPTLFIGGQISDYISPTEVAAIRRLFSKAEVQWVEGAGHWVHSERTSDFLQLAAPFLNQ